MTRILRQYRFVIALTAVIVIPIVVVAAASTATTVPTIDSHVRLLTLLDHHLRHARRIHQGQSQPAGLP
jgi:hypothetical protein